MNPAKKKTVRVTVWSVTLLHLLVYLLFHLPTLVLEIESNAVYEAFYYAHDLLYKALAFILPTVCCAVALGSYPSGGKWGPFLSSLNISLTQLSYILPYGYTYSVVSGGYDAVEALLIALGVSVGMVLLTALYGYGLYALVRYLAAKRSSRPAPTGAVSQRRLDDGKVMIDARKPFDPGSPYVFGIFVACLVQFCLRLCIELIDIIIFLVEFSGSYRVGEILYIVAVLLLLLVCMLGAHFLAVTLLGRLTKSDIDAPQKEVLE